MTGYSPTAKQHFWTAVCDDRGNQIDDLVYCDRCEKTFHSSQINWDTNTIRKGEKSISGQYSYM